jgi:hypothetical protein
VKRLEYSEEWGVSLETDHDEYMDNLWDTVDSDPASDEAEHLDVTGTYFCGCPACERRASWTWLMIRTVEGYEAGALKLVDDD